MWCADTDAHVQKRKAGRKVIFKRAESYVKGYLAKEKEEIRLKRAARAAGDFYVPAQPKVYFVIRIRGVNEIAPKPRKILQLLRLLQINNGVFVKATRATQQMLRLVEPYVTYGYVPWGVPCALHSKPGQRAEPQVRPRAHLQAWVRQGRQAAHPARGQRRHRDCARQVRHPVRRGPRARDHHRRPELQAGPCALLCGVQGPTDGPQASNFLWPFKLSNPTGGWRTRKFKHYVQGGDFGDRETNINKLVRQMN
jgi:large subunit ribosomal protein L7e